MGKTFIITELLHFPQWPNEGGKGWQLPLNTLTYFKIFIYSQSTIFGPLKTCQVIWPINMSQTIQTVAMSGK